MPFYEYIFAQESRYGVDQTLLRLLLPADRHGLSPMHEACIFHQLRTVKELVKEGEKVDEKDKFGRTPLYYVVVSQSIRPLDEKRTRIVRLLLDQGADINQNFSECDYSVENPLVTLAFRLRDSRRDEIFKIFLEYAAKLLV
ncbi:ankyrin repeat, PH and SEC7 domain containing protein secG isoform X1 [Nasonia vitripennis]|uniref:Uncharacterized protein n=1 Tax=Nasonia vitripennis TaxID=7425 RepID=A0A7M7TBJ1_NASVI|nr:ankyrin repeat, PH and SEC7 domain containing protein secG isoform X1 [Nasonia vitripennis]